MPGRTEVIGVYALRVEEELVRAQAEFLYGPNPSPSNLAQVRKQLESAVLVEVLVSNADAKFDVGHFVQPDPKLPRENWQAPWAEAFLSEDGERLLKAREKSVLAGSATFRVAFFMFYWKVDQPLLSSYGELPAVRSSAMPERLARLVPYELIG